MKIWANDLKIGDSFYYKRGSEIKHGTIVDTNKGIKTMMSYWNMDNGDIVFVNNYVSDSPNDLIDEVIEKIQQEKLEYEAKIKYYTSEINVLALQLEKYKRLKEEYSTSNEQKS